jgi:hypothetical protein
MNLVAIACVRDEIDVVEPFVRHTLAFASRIVVLDNGSTDGTRDVLAGLQHEGLPVDVVDDPSTGKYLSQRLTRLMHERAIAAYRADWILPLDADEFVHPGDAPIVVTGDGTSAPLLLPWRSYVPRAGDDPRERNPVRRLRCRLEIEGEGLWKVLVPRALADQPGAVIVQGSHALEIDGRHVPARRHARACLCHYPVRSAAQFLVKTVIGHLQNEVMPFRDSRWGWHHRDHYELLKQSPAAFMARLETMAARYSRQENDAPRGLVDDPLPYRGGPLRHTPEAGDALQAWPPVLRYVQELARRHALATGSFTDADRAAMQREDRVHEFLRNQLAERDRSLLRLQADNERLSADVELVRQSRTWRAGRWITAPASALRRALKAVF